MPKQIRILPWHPASNAAKAVARLVNGLRVRFNGMFRPKKRHLVINWGKADSPMWWGTGLNNPESVRIASNKLHALNVLKEAGIPIPEYTTDTATAQSWINDNETVVGRYVLNGHGGVGCKIFRKDGDSVITTPAPLYTKHLRHKREFRIHVFNNTVIDATEKLRRSDTNETRDRWIRNHQHGYVFARNNVQFPGGLFELAIHATATLGLDFGAVDIGYREKENKGYVFEVNTAPGITGTTLEKYGNAIRKKAAA